MERGELELLIYLITSAQGLPGEPRIYGSIRLTEAAYKLCRILLEREPENEKLKALAERLEQDKGKALSHCNDYSDLLNCLAHIIQGS